jgi:Fe-S-cluster-containing hydrogenase component 2
MIAHYGFQDGSGDYFISIDTEKCIACTDKHCIAACPEKILRIFVDDYDDEVVGVAEEYRQKIKYICTKCKSVGNEQNPACLKVCSTRAIAHSW